jgi:hypothetical protein
MQFFDFFELVFQIDNRDWRFSSPYQMAKLIYLGAGIKAEGENGGKESSLS